MIKIGSDFSGVGAFNQALIRLGIEYDELFACDMDKYARQTFIDNYGEPKYFPKDVYEREIPKESLDPSCSHELPVALKSGTVKFTSSSRSNRSANIYELLP